MTLLQILSATLLLVTVHRAGAQPAHGKLAWHEVQAEHVSGKGWTETAAPFDRLSAQAETLVRPAVWQLSRDSAGLSVDFSTDADRIAVRWMLTDPNLALPHMAATGCSGIDLYVKVGEQWQYAATARPTKTVANDVELVVGLSREVKFCRLYFPLYNGVSKVELGLTAGAALEFQSTATHAKPIVFYGTSITQGGCASRPGMAYPSILGRRLNVPTINLGFSGNGKCEPEIASLLAELDPALFVLDPLPNLFPEQAAERLPSLIETIRASRPETPIVLVESPRYADAPLVAARADRVEHSNRVVENIANAREQRGDTQFFVAPGLDFSAQGGEVTVDGTHPTDLGFQLMADALEPHVRRALRSSQ